VNNKYLQLFYLLTLIEKNFDIFEPSKLSNPTDYLKSNEIKNISTLDHKRRVELTREECKNIN